MKNNKFCIFVLIMLSSTLGVKQVDSAIINNTPKTNIEEIDNKMEEVYTFSSDIVLVNKENGLEKDNYIKEFQIPNVEFISNGDPNVRKMEKNAAVALEYLFNAAKNDNITLLGVSGYRDYSYQEKLYNDKVDRSGKEEADKYVAQAGESEHQTGLAMDLLSDEYTTLDEGFKNTKAYKWIIENCYKYGFILRYPEGKEQITGYDYEPWHIRYVGGKVAKEIVHRGITLEEYLNISIANR
ncbi:M15 family metallopeptidase [Clostridium sp.]|uniref:M15 family metallopeptidase n=1 Tax=Clostridium sp. TaxID=1506 RepID=UPI001A487DC7|nr:M15 family metallopeptidase [Clostridium sp.]MBK5240291.1 M15 family metallopeptidase [Clostridium sp.]